MKTTKTTTTKTISKNVTKAGFDKFNKMEGLRDILKEQGFKEKAPINFESKKYNIPLLPLLFAKTPTKILNTNQIKTNSIIFLPFIYT